MFKVLTGEKKRRVMTPATITAHSIPLIAPSRLSIRLMQD